jgi:branched-chain amino acid transport system substrate-binding protein
MKNQEEKRMKKFLALILALVMALSLVACGGSGSDSGDDSAASGDKVIKIGVFEPQSGDNGAGGKQEVLGVQYANSIRNTVTIGGEEYTVVLDIQDNQSSTDKAPSAAQQLIADGCVIVLGSYGSAVSIAAGSYFKDAQVPAIGISCTNAAVTAGNDYYFRTCFLDPFQGSVMASFAMDECKAQKAYVLAMLGDDYTVGLAKNFVSAFTAAGGTVVANETFTEGTSDFSSYLQTAVSSGADVIFCPSATNYAALIIEQAATKGVTIPLLAGDTWESNVISDAQAKASDVTVYCSTFFDENDESGLASEFVKGFKEYVNNDSTAYANNGSSDIVAAVSALGFDAYNVALDALEAAGATDGATVRDAIAALSGDYVTGSISFDENGDANKTTAYIKQAIDGGFSFVKVQSAD